MFVVLMMCLVVAISLVVGVLLGMKTSIKYKSIGTIFIFSDSDSDPYMFLDLETDIETLKNKEAITVRIKCQ